MKITVIGASGLIGSKLVKLLQQKGHEVVAASLTWRKPKRAASGFSSRASQRALSAKVPSKSKITSLYMKPGRHGSKSAAPTAPPPPGQALLSPG